MVPELIPHNAVPLSVAKVRLSTFFRGQAGPNWAR
jgi:hypothetical protein